MGKSAINLAPKRAHFDIQATQNDLSPTPVKNDQISDAHSQKRRKSRAENMSEVSRLILNHPHPLHFIASPRIGDGENLMEYYIVSGGVASIQGHVGALGQTKTHQLASHSLCQQTQKISKPSWQISKQNLCHQLPLVYQT